jgi:hypothetical protein
MIEGLRQKRSQLGSLLRRESGDKDASLLFMDDSGNLRDFLSSFPLAKNHFGVTASLATRAIHSGKSEIHDPFVSRILPTHAS